MSQLFTLPQQVRLNSSGTPYASAKAYFYRVGTLTAQDVYTTPDLDEEHPQPVQADSAGQFPAIWLNVDAAHDYRVIIKSSSDVQLDDYPIRRARITAEQLSDVLTPALIGEELYPTTTAEQTASVTPTNKQYPEGDLRRYGAVGDGATDDSEAWQRAINVGLAKIPSGYSFKILTGATKTGRVVIQGDGRSSKLLSDITVATITDGTDSVVENFYMENLTAPWIITRDPTDWLQSKEDLDETLLQSNGLGYQPTLNDFYWNGSAQVSYYDTLTTAQKEQNIGPQVAFYGEGTGVNINRIFGRFVTLYINGYSYCRVHDCDFRAGKSVFGGIQIDNHSNESEVGIGNNVYNNRVSYASYSGVDYWNNTDFECLDNAFFRCGESGIRMHAANSAELPYNYRGKMSGNQCFDNYYDGIDGMAQYPVPDDVPETFHQISDNYCYRNGGTGLNTDGRYNTISGNYFYKNGRYGIWNYSSYSHIVDNTFIDNNQERDTDWHELLLAGATGYNHVSGNYILGGVGQNNKGIYCFTNVPNFIGDNFGVGATFDFGAAGTSVQLLGTNIDSTRGNLTDQCFTLILTNDGGTLKHSIRGGDANSASLTLGITRVANASTTPTATPTGADGSTAFAAGGKIGSANTNYFIFDTAAQASAFADMTALLVECSTGDSIHVQPVFVSLDVNGTTRNRLALAFKSATAGTAYALNTTNIGSSENITVLFRGKLA